MTAAEHTDDPIPFLSLTGDGGTARTGEILLSPEFHQRYQMDKLLGIGACGIVFRARQLAMDRLVAIKFRGRKVDQAVR